MGTLWYLANCSLDGFTEDESGSFDWSAPDEELHRFYNDLMAGIGFQLLGRRMYETMAVWETDPSFVALSPVLAEFAAAWQDSDKIVYSSTLTEPITARTRISSSFDVREIESLKASTAADLLVSGPELAGHALRAGLVDRIGLVLVPVIIGGGKPALPPGLRLELELVDHRRFGNGSVYVAYRPR
ncbi:MAG: dihydrofolate reductase family protein [Acidimicrobiales bacterium]|nr:dihydrofolate reductase family protein [Acidimicrobiales bacterium]